MARSIQRPALLAAVALLAASAAPARADAETAAPPDFTGGAAIAGEPTPADAERLLYGDMGRRIDGSPAETVPPSAKSRTKETVWRGDVCSGRAGVEKGATGRVTAVSIRSAC